MIEMIITKGDHAIAQVNAALLEHPPDVVSVVSICEDMNTDKQVAQSLHRAWVESYIENTGEYGSVDIEAMFYQILSDAPKTTLYMVKKCILKYLKSEGLIR